MGLTVEEHNILIENNKMLKQLTGCIKSKDNVTSEEFIIDRNKITYEYLVMHKEVPDDLLNKVAETVAELNITYLDIF